MHILNLVKFCPFVLRILNGSEIWRKSMANGTNMQKMMCNNPNVDLVNMNAYIKFGEILSVCSQNIEWKQNFGVNQWEMVQMCKK